MYKVPKNGATVTIFAPYDCGNNCPFCVNKKEYKENPNFDLEEVINSITIMNKITPNCDFVITGGEPLADLDKFERIVLTIKGLNLFGSNHKLFINTTLPIKREDIDRINKFKDTITCINISRHINKYVKECDDELIKLLEVPVRINCVLYTEKEALYADKLINRFKDFKNVTGIQFRDNYIGVGYDNLYNCYENKRLDNLLKGLRVDVNDCKFHFTSFRWDCEISKKPLIKFHRTMCYSKIPSGDLIEINDVIINPRGDILDDWNEYGELLNLVEYMKGVKKCLTNTKIGLKI
jgi:organic radical activating enzyme